MREIRTSGLTRGSNWIGQSRPLLSTLLVQNSKFLSVFRQPGPAADHSPAFLQPFRAEEELPVADQVPVHAKPHQPAHHLDLAVLKKEKGKELKDIGKKSASSSGYPA